MVFTLRKLIVRFNYKNGYTYTAKNVPITVVIEDVYDQIYGKAHVQIMGIPYSAMTNLTLLSYIHSEIGENEISVYAQNGDGVETPIFLGSVMSASANFNSSPDVEFHVEAASCGKERLRVVDTTTINSTDNVKTIDAIQKLVNQTKAPHFTLKDNGVTGTITGQWQGSPIGQIEQICNQRHLKMSVDAINRIISISPEGYKGTVTGLVISSQTGLIGYPTIDDKGVSLRCFYNPLLRAGTLFYLKSIVPCATAEWSIATATHHLSSGNPNGSVWETQITAKYSSQWEG